MLPDPSSLWRGWYPHTPVWYWLVWQARPTCVSDEGIEGLARQTRRGQALVSHVWFVGSCLLLLGDGWQNSTGVYAKLACSGERQWIKTLWHNISGTTWHTLASHSYSWEHLATSLPVRQGCCTSVYSLESRTRLSPRARDIIACTCCPASGYPLARVILILLLRVHVCVG